MIQSLTIHITQKTTVRGLGRREEKSRMCGDPGTWGGFPEASNPELLTSIDPHHTQKIPRKSLFLLVKIPGKGWPNRTENIFGNIYPTQTKHQKKIHPSTHTSKISVGPRRELIFNPHVLHHFTSLTPCTGTSDNGTSISPPSGASRANQGGILPPPTCLKQAKFWFPCQVSVCIALWGVDLHLLPNKSRGCFDCPAQVASVGSRFNEKWVSSSLFFISPLHCQWGPTESWHQEVERGDGKKVALVPWCQLGPLRGKTQSELMPHMLR